MSALASAPEGVGIRLVGADARRLEDEFTGLLGDLGLAEWCETRWQAGQGGEMLLAWLKPGVFVRLTAGFDTLGLRERLNVAPVAGDAATLAREVWLALLGAPRRIDFDGVDELAAHVRVRCNIARAAQKTALAFKTTDAAERPDDYWHYEEDVGFLLKPGVCLVDALIAATQPERTGRLYDFSCYRASEYVILLGLAQEAKARAPGLYARLEATARHRCIKSGRFHEVFLTEYGSVDEPIPMRYYVPGDRVWFRNPDEASSNAHGYEGSWVIYMGGGLFSNFWQRDRPYTLESKALEVFHWRDGAWMGADSELHIDEDVVEAQVSQTQADPARRAQVLAQMNRYRDPSGVYGTGGCMDASREFPRQLRSIVFA